MIILQFLFLCILLILPFGELLRFQTDSGFGFTVLDMLVGVTSLSFILHSVATKFFPKSSLYKPIGIFLAVCVLSLLANVQNYSEQELLISGLYIVRFVGYSSILFLVLRFSEQFSRRIPFFLIVSGTVFVALGFLQYSLYPSLRNLYYLGWDEHMYRLFGTFLDPNFTGAFLVLFSLFLGSLVLNSKNKEQKFKQIILSLLSVCSLVAVFLTFSRSAYIMLFVGFGIFFFLQKKLKIFAGILAIFIIGLLFMSPQFDKENINLFRTASSMARVENAKEAAFIFTQNPVLGIGFNSYRFAKTQYGFGSSLIPTHSGSGIDNSFLFVLVTTGVVGFSAFLYMWGSIIRSVRMNRVHAFSAAAFSSIIALLVDSLFINSVFYSFIMLWMFIVIGLALRKTTENR